jgi:hypothetical protein
MPNSTSLQPALSQGDLSNATSQATTVTNYAQASITAVPQLQGSESWMPQVEKDVAAAQSNALNWLSNICPAMSAGMPREVISFNSDFQTASRQILSTLQEIISQPDGLPTSNQKDSVNAQLNTLVTKLTVLQDSANALLLSIGSFATALNTDQQRLAADLNTVLTQYAEGASFVRQISAIIGESFLNSTVLGPCNAIVMVDMNISLKVEQTGCPPDLISVIYIKTILGTQISNIQASQLSAQLILDSWNILNKKIAAVITDLGAASDDKYVAFIEQLDIINTQTQWQQLANYAQTLLPNA